ncbi:MAG: hypothetical protein M3485_06785 [Pseudomonadota bacterium]|nr:hypothetical protein [Pseudomonadota bacterium]
MKQDAFLMQTLSLEQLGQASFLDKRLGVSLASAQAIAVRELPVLPDHPAFLFHTAFCGSTLLARSLHAPLGTVALKEPAALLSLAHADLNGKMRMTPDARVLQVALSLLARPWVREGQVMIKPTNQVNRLLPILVRASGRPALLLYSSLEEFLISCFKKLPEAEEQLRWMARFLLPDTRLAARLGLDRTYSPNFVEACVLTWYAQMERYAFVLDNDPDDRLRSLDMHSMLAQPVEAVHASALWLGLEASLVDLSRRVLETFSRDSKRVNRSFGTAEREHEKAIVRQHFGPLIRKSLGWAEQTVLPAASLPVRWKPLLGAAD